MQRIYIYFILQVYFTNENEKNEILFYNTHFLQFQFTPLSSPLQSTPVNQPHDTPGKLLCVITQRTAA